MNNPFLTLRDGFAKIERQRKANENQQPKTQPPTDADALTLIKLAYAQRMEDRDSD